MSKGNSGGGAGVGGGTTTAGPRQNEAQRTHPNIAHLLNGSKIGSYAETKKDAKDEAKRLRQAGRRASIIKDPQGKGDRRYLIVVPENA